MTPRRVTRTQWVHRDEPKPEPVDIRTQKAKKLPMPGPGIVITVPLSLLPEYLQLYALTPMARGEVADHETATGARKPSGMLYVKRNKEGTNDQSDPGRG
jgi:hypothetical protein